MKIQNGRLYENKTSKYLYPSLRVYKSELTEWLRSFPKLAVGINDYNFRREDSLFILIDTTFNSGSLAFNESNKQRFDIFLKWLPSKSYYVADYLFDSANKHMIVLKFPKSYPNAMAKFKEGCYSQMYTKEEIDVGAVTQNNLLSYTKRYSTNEKYSASCTLLCTRIC